MTSEEIIKKRIEELANNANGAYYQYILANGQAFDKMAQKRLPQFRHFKMENRTQDQGCYANSQRFAQAYPGVKYYEGFRFAGLVIQGLPIIADFAWNVVDGDMVVEWVNSKRADVCSPVYFGVEVPIDFLKGYLGKEIVLSNSESPGIAVPVPLELGTPLLSWYLRLKEEGMP